MENDHPAIRKCDEFGITVEEGMIVLKRDIYASGKSICRVNWQIVTISTMREIGRTLVDIHGQHDNQEILNEKNHLALLDEFGGSQIENARAEYQSIYRKYIKIKKELAALNENEQLMAQRLDLLQFQFEEITQAELNIGEDEELQAEKKKLNNFEKLFSALSQSYEAMQGEQKGLDWLGLALSNMEEAQAVDEELTDVYNVMTNCYFQLEDAVHSIRAKLDELEFDPDRLNQIEERLNVIHQLKRKYGKTIEEILEYAAKIEEELEMIINKESHIDTLSKKLQSVEKDLLVEGKNLTNVRKQVAKKLTDAIHKELKELYMDKTIFEVRFLEQNDTEFKRDGIDEIVFILAQTLANR